jgi:hypothetical protein
MKAYTKEKTSILSRAAVFFLLLMTIVCVSCASRPYARVDNPVLEGNFSAGVNVLEREKRDLYTSRDTVLYYLDKGMLTHYAGDYADSIQLLQSAERGIQEAFTKSISLQIATYITNDMAQDYAGEDYEDVYVKAFNALNYYHQGDLEGALVEIRGMSQKLDGLSAKYAGLMDEARKEAASSGVTLSQTDAASSFSNSALACYLGMLFYRARGDPNAEVDQRNLKKAFADAPGLYPFPVPSSIDEEMALPKGKARLNVIAFAGLSPVKEAEDTRIPLGTGWIKISLPTLVSRPSRIARVEVELDGGERFSLELLENIEAVARETFKSRRSLIYAKSIIRATVKGGTAVALNAAAESEEDASTSLLLSLLGLGAQIFAESSEQADVRISRYFPARSYIGGITLDPGVYSFTVHYYDARGGLLESVPFQNIPVYENTLNLTEAVCTK